jgi:beta-lactamase superfamily II metal-dependent hydrolase
MRVHILDVGQGDTIIVEMPMGVKKKAFGVIDCYRFDDVTAPYLQKLKVEELAFVCGTHPHHDHIKDIPKLLKRYKVGEYWDSGYIPEYQPHYWLKLFDCLENYDIKKVVLRSGTSIHFGETIFHALSPAPSLSLDSNDPYFNNNNASIVISVQYGRSRVLLTGDANFGCWAYIWMTHKDLMKAQAVKISHHGSMHGNFLECLEYIRPKYAIISVGAKNVYDMPHDNVMKFLSEKIIRDPKNIFLTRDHGHIIVTSNGSRRLKITKEK